MHLYSTRLSEVHRHVSGGRSILQRTPRWLRSDHPSAPARCEGSLFPSQPLPFGASRFIRSTPGHFTSPQGFQRREQPWQADTHLPKRRLKGAGGSRRTRGPSRPRGPLLTPQPDPPGGAASPQRAAGPQPSPPGSLPQESPTSFSAPTPPSAPPAPLQASEASTSARPRLPLSPSPPGEGEEGRRRAVPRARPAIPGLA